MGILECLGWGSLSLFIGWLSKELCGEDVKDSSVIYDYQTTRNQYNAKV